MKWCVYFLKSGNAKWYYVGSTNRLDTRVQEHNAGKVKSTKRFIPLTIVYTKYFSSEKEAREYEHMIKDKRKIKKEIINSLKIS